MCAAGTASKAFILVYLLNQNLYAASGQGVTLPFKNLSVSSKTSLSSTPCTADTLSFSPKSLPPVQTQQSVGQNYQVLGQTSVVGSPSSQLPGQPSNFEQNQRQYYQLNSFPNGGDQNSVQNLVLTSNQNQNSGINNLAVSPATSQSSSLSSASGIPALSSNSFNLVPSSGPSQSSFSPLSLPIQASDSYNLISSPGSPQSGSSSPFVGSPVQTSNFNMVSSPVPSSLSVTTSQNPSLNYSPNLVTLNSNYVSPQSYPFNIISNSESQSLNNGYNNAIIPPSVPIPVSNSGFSPQVSFTFNQPTQSCSSNSQPLSGFSSQPSFNIQPSQGASQPTFKLTDIRPLNLNSASNVNLNSLSFKPSCNTLPQLPSTLPSPNPVNLAQSNQYSFNLGVSPSLLQDLNNFPSSIYNAFAPPNELYSVQNINSSPQLQTSSNCPPPMQTYGQLTLQNVANSGVSLSSNPPPTLNYGQLSLQNPANSVLSSSSNQLIQTQNTAPALNYGQLTLQNPTNSGASSCTNQLVQAQNQNPALNYGQLTLQNPSNSGVSSYSNQLAQTQSQNLGSLVSSGDSQQSLILDQELINQLFSSIASSTPSVQSSSTYSQINVPQLNSYVQPSLPSAPTTYFNNVGSPYVPNYGSTQNVLQNQANSQVSSNIIDLYNELSSRASRFQPVFSSDDSLNTVSELPSVYTSNLDSSTNLIVPRLTPSSILSAYNSNTGSSSLNFEPIMSALRSPTITTEEIASLVSSLAESVLQQCNTLTSSPSSTQSNFNALPITVTTTPVENNFVLPTFSSQYLPQQQSVSYFDTPSLEAVENVYSNTQNFDLQTGIPIRIVAETPFTSDSSPSSLSNSKSSCSSPVQSSSVESSVFPPKLSPSASVSDKSTSGIGTKDLIKALVFSEILSGNGGGCGGCGNCGGCGGGSGLDSGLLALLLASVN